MKNYREIINRLALGTKRDNRREHMEVVEDRLRSPSVPIEEKVKLYHVYKKKIEDSMFLINVVKKFLPAKEMVELLERTIKTKSHYRMRDIVQAMHDRKMTIPENVVRQILSKENWDYEQTPKMIEYLKVPKDIVVNMLWNGENEYRLRENPANARAVGDAQEGLRILESIIEEADIAKLDEVFEAYGKNRIPLEFIIVRLDTMEMDPMTPERRELTKKVFAAGLKLGNENTIERMKYLVKPIEADDELFRFAIHALLEKPETKLIYDFTRYSSEERASEMFAMVEAQRKRDEEKNEYGKNMYGTTSFLLGLSQNNYVSDEVLQSIFQETLEKLKAGKTTNYAHTELTTLSGCIGRLMTANEIARFFLENKEHRFAATLLKEMAKKLDAQTLNIALDAYADILAKNADESKYEVVSFFNTDADPAILEKLFSKITSEEVRAEIINEFSSKYKFLLKYAKSPEGFADNDTSQKLFKHMRSLKALEDLLDKSGLQQISPKELKRLQPELLSNPIVVELFRASQGKSVDKAGIRAFAEGYSGTNYDVFWGSYHDDVQVDKSLAYEIRSETKREVFALGMTELDAPTTSLLEKLGRRFHDIGFKNKNLGWILFRNISVVGYPAILIEQIQSDLRNVDDILKDYYQYVNEEKYSKDFDTEFGAGAYEGAVKNLKNISKNYGELVLSGFLKKAAGFTIFITGRDTIKEVAKLSDVAATELYQKLPQRFGFKPSQELPGYMKLERAALSGREMRRTAMKNTYFMVGYSDYGVPEFRVFTNRDKVRQFLDGNLGGAPGKQTVRTFQMEEGEYNLLLSKPTDYKLIQKRKELADDLKQRFMGDVGQLWKKPENPDIPKSPEELLAKKRPWLWKDKTNSSLVVSQREMNFIQMWTPAMGASVGHETYGVKAVSPKKQEVFEYLWPKFKAVGWEPYYQGGIGSDSWFYIEFMQSGKVEEAQLMSLITDAAGKFGLEIK
jgi:hypothetical protein